MKSLMEVRTMLTGILVGVFVFGAIAIGSPRIAYASVPSVYLDFYCTYTLDWTGAITPADAVQVLGPNQDLQTTWKYFPTNYTWADGHYWWYAVGYTISYTAWWHTGMPWNYQYHSAVGYATVPYGWYGLGRVVMPFC